MPFTCSICGEESTHICVRCTKDACDNHLCERCHRCSDCCECEVHLDEPVHEAPRMVARKVEPEDAEEPLEDEPPEDEPLEEPNANEPAV